MEWEVCEAPDEPEKDRAAGKQRDSLPDLWFSDWFNKHTTKQPNIQPTNQTTKYSNNPKPAVALLPEYHHVGGSLGEGDDEAGDPHQDDEGQQEVGTATAAGPGPGRTRTVRDAPTVCEVL